jgi:hypothetical protein
VLDPPPLPRTEGDDLAAWHAYARRLRDAGDWRGAVIDFELALPARPSAEQQAEWLRRTRRRFRLNGSPLIGWCLGHARDVTVGSWGNELGNAWNVLTSPIGRTTDEVTITLPPDLPQRLIERIFGALPSSCTRLCLEIRADLQGNLIRAIDRVPRTVRHLELQCRYPVTGRLIALFVDDRFDLLALRVPLTESEWTPVAAALARTAHVRVAVLDALARLSDDDGDRVVHGDPGEAALLGVDGEIHSLRRVPVGEHQREHGVVPLRTQLAGVHGAFEPGHWWQHGDRWFFYQDAAGGSGIDVVDGGTLYFRKRCWRLAARDVDARWRALNAR